MVGIKTRILCEDLMYSLACHHTRCGPLAPNPYALHSSTSTEPGEKTGREIIGLNLTTRTMVLFLASPNLRHLQTVYRKGLHTAPLLPQ